MKNKPFFLLAAEDDSDDRFLLNLILKKTLPDWQYEILHNGLDLLKYLATLPEGSPDISLIMLDINMPLKDGIETLKELRAHQRYKHLPIIAFSTARDETVREKFFKAGGTAYLTKPDSIDEIEAVILNLTEIAQAKI